MSLASVSDGVSDPADEVAEVDIAPGAVLAGRYRVLQLLGRGGMGSVYLAEHIEVGRKVAIKILLAQWSATDSIVRRFRAESRTASAIGHPNIVQVFDAGSLPDGRLFLVMEHLAGRDLEDELLTVRALEPRRACVIMRQIALALGAGHRAGIVHRDLKPSNVMLVPQPDGEAVKVLDFGIAANAGLLVGGGERLTDPGSLMGTPEYMAPEQATNAAPRPTFDVYAMGVMLYEMLGGGLPFTATHAFELLTLKLNNPAPPLDARRPGLLPGLVKLVADCLGTEPGDRPPDGDAVAARLDELLLDMRQNSLRIAAKLGATTPVESMVAPQPSPLAAPPAANRRRGQPVLVGALALICAAAATWVIGRGPRGPDPQALAAVVPPMPSGPPPAEVRPVAQPDVPRDMLAGDAGTVEPTPVGPAPPAALELPTTAPAESEPAPTKPAATTRPAAKSGSRPVDADAHLTPRCQRVRSSAEDARRAQRWAVLRDSSRQRECWASAAEARKLETKALMELGDFHGCLSVGKGLKDQEAQNWLKLCQKRVGG